MRLLKHTRDYSTNTDLYVRQDGEEAESSVLDLLIFFNNEEAGHSKDSSSEDRHRGRDDDVVIILFT